MKFYIQKLLKIEYWQSLYLLIVNFTESCKLYHGSCRWRKSGDFNWKRVKDNEIPAIVAGMALKQFYHVFIPR